MVRATRRGRGAGRRARGAPGPAGALAPERRSGAAAGAGAGRSRAAPAPRGPVAPPPPEEAVEPLAAALTPPAVLAGAALAAGAGYAAGGPLAARLGVPPGTPPAASKAVAAAASGALALVSLQQVEAVRGRSAARALRRALASGALEADGLTPADAQAVLGDVAETGSARAQGELEAELMAVYAEYLAHTLPAGEEALKGDEAAKLRGFLDAVGLADEAAAKCHLDLGQQISRLRMEQGDLSGAVSELRAFQKLVYVSEKVFGTRKSAFLTPWRRVFNLTESQVKLAKADNAKSLFMGRLGLLNEDYPGVDALHGLRHWQLEVQLPDDAAAACMAGVWRARAEAMLDNALEQVNLTQNGVNGAVGWLDALRAFRTHLRGFEGDEAMPPGAAAVGLAGGKWAGRKKDAMNLLATYVRESIAAAGGVTPQMEAAVAELREFFGFGEEVDAAKAEIVAQAYRLALATAYAKGEIDQEDSQAQWLQGLCQKFAFSPEQAFAMHADIYRTKLQEFLAKGFLTEADDEELRRLQKNLCIQTPQAKEVEKELKGNAMAPVLNNIFKVSSTSFENFEVAELERAVNNFRCDADIVKPLLDQRVQDKFMTFIEKAKKLQSAEEVVLEYDKMFDYNTKVTEVLYKIDPTELADAEKRAAEAELQVTMMYAQQLDGEGEGDAAAGGDQLKKELMEENRRTQMASEIGDAKQLAYSQKTFHVQDQLTKEEKSKIYQAYYVEMLRGGMGATTSSLFGTGAAKPSTNKELNKVGVLGDILGLTTADVVAIRQEMSVTAYKDVLKQVESAKWPAEEKNLHLAKTRQALMLSDEQAEACLQEMRAELEASTVSQLHARGALTAEKVHQLVADGVKIDQMMDDRSRVNFFRSQVERGVAAGTGDFDAALLLDQLPADLELDAKRTERIIREVISDDKKRTLFVQCVSFLRQEDEAETLRSLNNLVACYKARPGGPIKWLNQEERNSAFQLYASRAGDPAKVDALQAALGLEDADARRLRELVGGGAGFSLKRAAGKDGVDGEELTLPF